MRPDGVYDPPPDVRRTAKGMVIDFVGDDGRRATFSFAGKPVPTMHAEFAAAVNEHTGLQGSARTLKSAQTVWGAVIRFLAFLADLSDRPRAVSDLTSAHIDAFVKHRESTVHDRYAGQDAYIVLRLLDLVPSRSSLQPDLMARLELRGRSRLTRGRRHDPVPGYSDGERASLFAAAREDVAAIRNRIRSGRELVRRFQDDPQSLSVADRETAALLASIATAGRVPRLLDTERRSRAEALTQRELASRLFLLDQDLAPLLVFGICVTGRNGETLKELPAAHEVLEDRAVRVELTKRRRGKSRMFETVHWEVGDPVDGLRTPGGFYLLIHELTEMGRRFSKTPFLWSIWLNGGYYGNRRNRHEDPFAIRLDRDLQLRHWVARKGIVGDDGDPLLLKLSRLKKTEDIRRTRALGGHLPSAALTNGVEVLFRDYLAGDPTVREWAADILQDAIQQAEASARQFAPHVLDTATEDAARRDPEDLERRIGAPTGSVAKAFGGALDTVAASCLDFDHHPSTGKRCRASFAQCLLCPNALVLERHLPGLHALRDELQIALDTRDAESWCAKFGLLWLILTRHVLPKFTDAQRRNAAAATPGVVLAVAGLREL